MYRRTQTVFGSPSFPGSAPGPWLWELEDASWSQKLPAPNPCYFPQICSKFFRLSFSYSPRKFPKFFPNFPRSLPKFAPNFLYASPTRRPNIRRIWPILGKPTRSRNAKPWSWPLGTRDTSASQFYKKNFARIENIFERGACFLEMVKRHFLRSRKRTNKHNKIFVKFENNLRDPFENWLKSKYFSFRRRYFQNKVVRSPLKTAPTPQKWGKVGTIIVRMLLQRKWQRIIRSQLTVLAFEIRHFEKLIKNLWLQTNS